MPTSFLSLHINYLAHTRGIRVKFVDLCLRVMKMAQAEAPLSKLPWMANRPTYRQGRPTPESTQQNSWRPLQTVGDRTLLQIWRPLTKLSIRYTASSSDRLNCRSLDSINFLAAASDKRMRLLTSLYGTIVTNPEYYDFPSVAIGHNIFLPHGSALHVFSWRICTRSIVYQVLGLSCIRY